MPPTERRRTCLVKMRQALSSTPAFGPGVGIQHKLPNLNVDVVGSYNPSAYNNGVGLTGIMPLDLADWNSQVMPSDAKIGGLSDPKKVQGWDASLRTVRTFGPALPKNIPSTSRPADCSRDSEFRIYG